MKKLFFVLSVLSFSLTSCFFGGEESGKTDLRNSIVDGSVSSLVQPIKTETINTPVLSGSTNNDTVGSNHFDIK